MYVSKDDNNNVVADDGGEDWLTVWLQVDSVVVVGERGGICGVSSSSSSVVSPIFVPANAGVALGTTGLIAIVHSSLIPKLGAWGGGCGARFTSFRSYQRLGSVPL